MKPIILYENKDVMVCQKPPKVPSQPDKTGDEDMFSIIDNYLTKNSQHEGKTYLSLHHRLDRPVGGLMIFSKSKKGNKSLSQQIQDRKIEKKYLAVVCGTPTKDNINLEHYLKRFGKTNMSKVVDQSAHGAKKAKLEFQLLETITTEDFGDLSLISITLDTVRHHQIRVQLSHIGLPIWGDTKYNKTTKRKKKWDQIALWAYSLAFISPHNNSCQTIVSKPINEFPFTLFDYINSNI